MPETDFVESTLDLIISL